MTIRLRYLPVNQVWAFVFGDSLLPINGRQLFPSRAEAVADARTAGLDVDTEGVVQLTPSPV